MSAPGKPWNIWRPIVSPNFHSPLFEVEHGEEHGRLAAWHDDHVVGVHLRPVATVKIGGHRLAKGGDAIGGRVAMVAVVERPGAGLDDMLGRTEIGLADAEVFTFPVKKRRTLRERGPVPRT